MILLDKRFFLNIRQILLTFEISFKSYLWWKVEKLDRNRMEYINQQEGFSLSSKIRQLYLIANKLKCLVHTWYNWHIKPGKKLTFNCPFLCGYLYWSGSHHPQVNITLKFSHVKSNKQSLVNSNLTNFLTLICLLLKFLL